MLSCGVGVAQEVEQVVQFTEGCWFDSVCVFFFFSKFNSKSSLWTAQAYCNLLKIIIAKTEFYVINFHRMV